MASEAKGGSASERREQIRHAVHLPVKVTFFAPSMVERTSVKLGTERQSVKMMAERPSAKTITERPSGKMVAERPSMGMAATPSRRPSELSNEPLVVHALAVDVSEQGMRLEIAGAPLRALLETSDPLVKLEVAFTHPELRSIGTRLGHAQWRRAGERSTWGLGARFDVVFKPHEMSRILRIGRIGNSEDPERSGTLPLLLIFGFVLALVSIGWFRTHSADAAERDRLQQRLSSVDDDLVELKGAEERCRAELNARPTAAASAGTKAAPAPTPLPAAQAQLAATEPPSQPPALEGKGAASAAEEPSAGVAPPTAARPAHQADAAIDEDRVSP
jgi:hypothetical protein